MGYVGKVTAGGSTHLVGSTLYGTCATAAATAAKVVTCSDFTTLITGVTIHVKFTYANGVANPTLNVNSTGAKSIYRYGTTAPSTSAASSWQAGAVVSFTYDGSAWIQNDWLNNNDNNYDRAVVNRAVKAAAAVTAGQIIVGTSAGYKPAASGVTFDISYPILWASTAIDSGATKNNTYAYYTSVNLQTTKSGYAGATYSTVYLVCSSLNGNIATVHPEIFRTTQPTSADGLYYIPLGLMYSTTACYFYPINKVFKYYDGAFREVYADDVISNLQLSCGVQAQQLCRFYRDRTGNYGQQGMAVIDENYAVFLTVNTTYTSATITKFNYNTGVISSTNTINGVLGHSNDATFNAKSGYIEVAVDNASVGLARINPSTLALVDTKPLKDMNGNDQYLTGIAYDRISGYLYGRVGATFLKFDATTYTALEQRTMSEPQILSTRFDGSTSTSATLRQGSIAINNKVGTMYTGPNGIMFYDFSTGKPVKFYSIPLFINNAYPSGETESCDSLDGKTIICASNCVFSPSFKAFTYIYKLSLSNNAIDQNMVNGAHHIPVRTLNMYCDATTTDNCPDGTLFHPFRFVEEAVHAAMNQTEAVTIHLTTAGDYGPFVANGLANPAEVVADTTGTYIDGIILDRATSVRFRGINLKHTGYSSYPIRVSQSIMILSGCDLMSSTSPGSYYGYLENGARLLTEGSVRFRMSASSFTTSVFYLINSSSLDLRGVTSYENVSLSDANFSSIDSTSDIFHIENYQHKYATEFTYGSITVASNATVDYDIQTKVDSFNPDKVWSLMPYFNQNKFSTSMYLDNSNHWHVVVHNFHTSSLTATMKVRMIYTRA